VSMTLRPPLYYEDIDKSAPRSLIAIFLERYTFVFLKPLNKNC